MISGVHTILFSKKAEAVRAFLRDVLKFPFVDAGHGWLIFAAPPGELAVHPSGTDEPRHELYLMCDDVKSAIAALESKGVECAPIRELGWGLLTLITLPDGQQLGLYEPRHVTAINNNRLRLQANA